MADINEEVKVTNGVYGGVSVQNNGEEANGFNAENDVVISSNVGNALPAKTGFWSKLKAVLFYDIKVELTPYQQKVENEINEFLHQEITWAKVKDFLFQEVTFGKKSKV